MAFAHLNLITKHYAEVAKLTRALEASSATIKVTVSATAYTTSKDDDVGSMGTTVTPGKTLAVSRDIYPALKGKTVWLEGLGFLKVEDKMAARWTKKCDVLVVGHAEAVVFGHKKQLKMVVIDGGAD